MRIKKMRKHTTTNAALSQRGITPSNLTEAAASFTRKENNTMITNRIYKFALLAVFAGLCLTASVKAATLTVDTTADNPALAACTAAADDCSIGGAVANANASGEADTINFDASVFGTHQTINLNDGPFITADGKLTINGPAAGVTLSLANSNKFPIRVFGLFNVNAELEISNLTLTGGNTFQGGAIYSVGTVTINNSIITGNKATETGGGLTNRFGKLTVNNSTVSNNSSFEGGGVFNGNNGTTTITDSTVSGNSARFGGGIRNPQLGSTVMMTNSTISGNSAIFGGGIHTFGILPITNSTVSNNSALSGGGGVWQANGEVRASNTIFADNTSPNGPDYAGFVFSLGYNLFETPPTTGGSLPTDLVGVDPSLGPLQDNGGPTFTHALLASSPAIDAGNSTLTTDQRGFPRPVDFPLANAPGGNGSDIGAFEAGKEQCKKGGWMILGSGSFRNQGDCIQFVNTGK